MLPKLQRPTDVRNLIVLAVLALLASIYYGKIPYTVEPFSGWDLGSYLPMAEAAPNLDSSVTQPFAFRILGPYLAGLLPVSEPTGFRILAVSLSVLCSGLLYVLFRRAGVSPTVALVVAALALLNRYVFGEWLFNYFRVADLLSAIFLIVLFLALWGGRWAVFGVTLVLGVLTKETAVLMIPVAFVYLLERREGARRWRRALLAVLPGALLFVLLRAFVPNGGGNSLFEALATYSYKLYNPESLFRGLVNTFLPFTLVPLVFFRRTVAFFREHLHLLAYLVLVYLSTTFGLNEERLVAPAFIVFFSLLGVILDGVRAGRWTFAVLLAAGFASSLHHVVGVWQLPSSDWTRAIVLGAGLGVTLYMVLLKRTRGLQAGSTRSATSA